MEVSLWRSPCGGLPVDCQGPASGQGGKQGNSGMGPDHEKELHILSHIYIYIYIYIFIQVGFAQTAAASMQLYIYEVCLALQTS